MTENQGKVTRRQFVQTSAALASALVIPSYAYAGGAGTLKVAIIGCGGRGSSGIIQSIRSSPEVELIALGDLQQERIDTFKRTMAREIAADASLAPKYKVTDSMCFTGFDAYKKVLATDADIVMLATPPAFRPLHLRAAVEAGKHIFAEKPVATDVVGVRHVLATAAMADAKKLGIGVGTQRRHHPGYIEIMNRIQGGAIGDVLNGQVYWNQGGLWKVDKKPEWTDTEWQIRNWLYFTWLSGDHYVEQHVHNIDVANWVMGATPIRAVGVGGRQSRVEPVYGHIFDHFAVDFEYPNGVHITSMARQIGRAQGKNGEWFQGTKGKSHTSENGPQKIDGAKSYEWMRPDTFVNPMVQEHTDLIASIRAGKPHNHLKRIAETTLTAIMGREAAYTGQTIEWDSLLAADQDINPAPLANVAYGPLETPPVAVPGRTIVARKFMTGW